MMQHEINVSQVVPKKALAQTWICAPQQISQYAEPDASFQQRPFWKVFKGST